MKLVMKTLLGSIFFSVALAGIACAAGPQRAQQLVQKNENGVCQSVGDRTSVNPKGGKIYHSMSECLQSGGHMSRK